MIFDSTCGDPIRVLSITIAVVSFTQVGLVVKENREKRIHWINKSINRIVITVFSQIQVKSPKT